MRRLGLLTLLVASACGRSTFGPRADAGNVGQDTSQPVDVAGRDAAVTEASVDRRGSDVEADSSCRYQVDDQNVASCGGGHKFITKMSDLDGCPRYLVYEGTSQDYDLLGVVLSENGCEDSCLWEADLFDVVDCSGQMNRMTAAVVTGYADHFRTCPIPTIWHSSVTGKLYTTHDEARATLPVCVDAGR